DHIRPLAGNEDVDLQLLAGLVAVGVVRTELDDEPARLPTVLVEVALHRLGGAAATRTAERDLESGVTVALRGLDLSHVAGTCLDHGHGNSACVVEDLGHAQLLPEDPLDVAHQSLISMSTPAERFSRWSSWTVLEVASTMSMSRLWVSIWKCSRESLCLCG